MRPLLTLAALTLATALPGQIPPTTLAEDLGYGPDARLLIVHADDLGMAHAVNAASFRALDSGYVNSASIMVPTPWLPEVAAYAKTHPEADLGLHLTLTSEWTNYRWGPTGRDSVATLLDEHGYLHGSCPEMAAGASVAEIARELRRQVALARAMGIEPTHFDTHMGCLTYSGPEIFGAYLELGRAHGLPVLADRATLRDSAYAAHAALVEPGDLLVDQVIGAPTEAQGAFADAYDELIRGLPPGVTVLLLHTAFDGDEFRAAAAPQIPYGAAWRQEDFDYFTSERFAELLAEEGIVPVTWRELSEAKRAGGR